MSELSSCYFCGTALDAPVQRYPLTPPSVDAETGRSVALCPTCRRKLVKVLEVVAGEFDAVVGTDSADEATGDAEGTTAPDPGPAASDTADADGDDTGDAEAAPSDATDEATDPDADTADTAAAAEDTATETADEIESDATASTFEGSTETASEDDDATTADAFGSGPTAGDGGATAEADAAGAPDDSDAGRPTDAGQPADAEQAVDPGASTDTAQDDEPEAGSDDGKPAALTTSEAQQVVKLLQNREFPVEREEFEIVASNAYDIPMVDCEEVIDTLVAEGYVDESGDQLVRPE